jgi:hypothetical protein
MATLPSNLIDDAALTIADGINTGAEAFKDGFQIQDLFKFIPTFLSAQTIVENKDELLAQLKDYDLAERGVTIGKIRDRFQWTNEKAEELVGIVYDVVFGIVRGVIFMAENKPA